MRHSVFFLALLCATPLAAQDLPLRINGREYLLPPTQPIRLLGVDTVASALADAPDGLQVRWLPSAQRGANPELIFSYTLEGPVTSVDPLAVLGQPLTLDGNTLFEGLSPATPMIIGQELSLSGLVDVNGSLLVTLIELPEQALSSFSLTGYVNDVALGGDLLVGQQWIAAAGVATQNCPPSISVGAYVSVTANGVSPFPPGTTLSGITNLQCTQPVPQGTPGATGWVQGLISLVSPTGDFQIGELTVQLTPQTVVRFGTLDDIDAGSAVTIDGTFSDTTTLVASAIEFAHQVVRFEAPMASTQVIAGESVAPFGLHVTTTAQLRDEDGIVTNGLSAETQVQVRGYQDQDGALWMTRVRERGNPDPEDTSLRAPVSAINGSELSVLGLTVDTSQAVFFDIFENPITTEQFFAALQVGDGVDVATATWIPEQSRLIAGEVSIAKQIPAPGPAQRGSALGIIGGTASGYQRAALIYANGFEAN